MRIRWIERKLRAKDENGAWHSPDDVCEIMKRWDGNSYQRIPGIPATSSEIARIDQYLADPITHSVVPHWNRNVVSLVKKEHVA
jgi:hypothetical protein